MARSVPEWWGATDDTPVPPRVRLRVFERWKGKDHTTGRKIMPGEPWQTDHIVALVNGGENRESNLAPILVDKHKDKTARDVEEKSRIAEKRAKHIGVIKPKGNWGAGRNTPFKAKIGGGIERR